MKFKLIISLLLSLLLTNSCIDYKPTDFADSTWCARDGATIKLYANGSCEVSNLNRVGMFPRYWYSDSIGSRLYPSTFTGQWTLKSTPNSEKYIKITIDGTDNYYAFKTYGTDQIYARRAKTNFSTKDCDPFDCMYLFTRQEAED